MRLTEMYRVLKPGGKAFIIDLRPDASPADIAAAVDGMKLSWLNALRHKVDLQAHAAQARPLERELSADGCADAVQDVHVPGRVDRARGQRW